MAKPIEKKLNWIEKNLPEGLLVDAAWLSRHGYSTSLRSHYVAAGWLEQPARGVYRRQRGTLSWQQAIISLQTILGASSLVVGGRTALELQGYAHYLRHTAKDVHLYGLRRPPAWLHKLNLGTAFVYHNDRRLFSESPIVGGLLGKSARATTGDTAKDHNLTTLPWDQWEWPLTVSSPERAILQLLDELPDKESFHQVDKLFEGLANLSPRHLTKLLADCQSVKVKRLFVYFANRYRHAWLKRIDLESVDLGKGKRMLVKGGRLDAATQITVPEDLDGVR